MKKRVIIFPKNKPVVLHEKAALMSFENCSSLNKIYKEIIGIRNINHFSLNVVDSTEKMSILSYNPQIAYNIFKDGSYRYNGSLSPDFYNHYSLYTWDETYDPAYATLLTNNMERKNGIEKGVVLIKKVNDLTLLYSFATKTQGEDFLFDIKNDSSYFYQAGDHCFL